MAVLQRSDFPAFVKGSDLASLVGFIPTATRIGLQLPIDVADDNTLADILIAALIAVIVGNVAPKSPLARVVIGLIVAIVVLLWGIKSHAAAPTTPLRGSAITDGDVFGKIEVIVEGECWRVAGVKLINGQRLPLSSVRVL